MKESSSHIIQRIPFYTLQIPVENPTLLPARLYLMSFIYLFTYLFFQVSTNQYIENPKVLFGKEFISYCSFSVSTI